LRVSQRNALSGWWYDRRLRGWVAQALLVAAIAVAVGYLVSNTVENLQRQGIASGFAFLSSEAGFGILQSLIDYSETSSYGRAFLVGLLNTLLVAGVGIVLATFIGFVMGVARLSSNWLVARLAGVYVEAVRNVPLLLQLFFWYFGVLRALPSPRNSVSLFDSVFLNIRGLYLPAPSVGAGWEWVVGALAGGLLLAAAIAGWARRRRLRSGRAFPAAPAVLLAAIGPALLAAWATGFPFRLEYPVLKGFNFSGGLVLVPEFVALVLALSIYTGAFIAEIVRAGIMSVNRGQTEAALALGLSRRRTLRLVVIPQALRVIIPPLTSQYLNLTKNSSLAAAIAYPELVSVFAGTVLNQTGQAIEVIAITMGVYLAISLLIAGSMNLYNRRIALVER
jgi:general L-amino acid transport system permease protein